MSDSGLIDGCYTAIPFVLIDVCNHNLSYRLVSYAKTPSWCANCSPLFDFTFWFSPFGFPHSQTCWFIRHKTIVYRCCSFRDFPFDFGFLFSHGLQICDPLTCLLFFQVSLSHFFKQDFLPTILDRVYMFWSALSWNLPQYSLGFQFALYDAGFASIIPHPFYIILEELFSEVTTLFHTEVSLNFHISIIYESVIFHDCPFPFDLIRFNRMVVRRNLWVTWSE